MKKRILLVCTGNTCRSQMAAALVEALRGESWQVSSAGTDPGSAPEVRAILALREIGIETTGTPPVALSAYSDQVFDLLVTFSERAQQAAAILFPQARRVHLPVDDPLGAPYPPDDPVLPYREACATLRALLLPLLDRESRQSGVG